MKTNKSTEIHFIVENLIKIRNSKRLSQADFSELVGIDYTIYNKIETGYQKLSLEKLSKIATNLQMREIDIYTFPDVYVKKGAKDIIERVSVTFDVSPENRDILLNLVTGK